MATKPEILTVDPVEAIEHFRKKDIHIGFDWRDTVASQHLRSFTVAKMMDLDLLEDIRKAVRRAITNGTTFETFRDELEPLLKKSGWWDRKEVIDPVTGERVLAQLGSPRRLRTIFDVNLRTAYAHGRWQQIERLAEERPYLRYVGILDGRIRPLHRSWHGTVLRVDDPWWQTHYPPNGWRCRCSVRQLSEDDMERYGYEVTPRAPDDGMRDWVNKRTGEIERVPKGIDPGWAHNVGLLDPGIESRRLIEGKARSAPEVIRESIDTSLDGLIGTGREIRKDIDTLISDKVTVREFPDEFRRELRRRLRAERGAGTVVSNIGDGNGGRVTAGRVRKAVEDLPASWVQAGNRVPLVGKRATRRAGYWHPFHGRPGQISARDQSSALHEYIHHLQQAIPELNARFTELHRRRTKGHDLVAIYPDRPALRGERGRPDDYVDPYTGKEYSGDPREVMTMAFQQLLHRVHDREFLDKLFDKDPELLDLAIGALFKFDPDRNQ